MDRQSKRVKCHDTMMLQHCRNRWNIFSKWIVEVSQHWKVVSQCCIVMTLESVVMKSSMTIFSRHFLRKALNRFSFVCNRFSMNFNNCKYFFQQSTILDMKNNIQFQLFQYLVKVVWNCDCSKVYLLVFLSNFTKKWWM